jgi:hypothetical protein
MMVSIGNFMLMFKKSINLNFEPLRTKCSMAMIRPNSQHSAIMLVFGLEILNCSLYLSVKGPLEILRRLKYLLSERAAKIQILHRNIDNHKFKKKNYFAFDCDLFFNKISLNGRAVSLN